ncbi:SCL-interrupting locus protein homolog isoform X1 [Hippoglossus hippoglossus]|uniref:SCL-interrupting locus protein homolog isoform X1 n=1 Tax=Hippoglossus hippoglossus TaxID=8267 RepID=UPI00148D362C|nr:SCL-interrupting locus protein homolog isoform X1 [Hippoglossus hippoglossus]XP_034438147.1 SCL-interrupting locus protein homolog isoform X1 [Hippoglossus hippoglossus]XP_034438148.1 SCL-interrupting locus protein homolog isoform X1 [Hippoglossus hippoglossus]XP_034438149.1 SCL-interrupting locus protein homolog isoform X1 [Hippoglossus hippoglossus]XP_034438151.1 SCL-interrupting locus protein homolog isoform X1 [Hippoglossus hippoglossus]XP_034438152.1 SCL-interrupting locus protein homo
MSYPVKLQTLPAAVFEDVFTPENVRGRNSTNSLMLLSFPKSRSALWDGPSGDMLRLQLCSHRKPRVVLLEKALRLAQRHVRHSNKPRLHCFFLGSVCVDSDEEGVTVTLNRFDPGRDQVGSSARVPTALLPGDVLVPCLFSTQTETSPVTVIQSEAEIHHSVKALQQFVSSRQTLDLSQLIKVRGRVVCSQQSDTMVFSLSWSAICPSVSMDIQPVRAIPIIPTALLRSLIGVGRTLQHATNCHRGFLTMDQTRKLLLLLESDPKAANLPLVGLWLSGVTHMYNPQVMSWCLRFLFSTALQERVLSESGCFLLVLFAATHRAPQFFQCRGPGPGLQLDCEFLSASQSVTLYQQVASVDGQSLQCELSSDDHRQTETFRAAQSSFNSAPPSAAGVSVTDQDSGVEDEDLSPRPSPSPHAPAQQSRRVQPSVPELSLLIDSSFTWQDPGSAHRCLPLSSADRKSAPPTGSTPTSSSPAPRPPPPHLHSTPNSNLQPPSTCYSPYTCNSTPILSSAAPPPPTFRNHPMTPPAPPSSTRGLFPPPSHDPLSPPSLLLPPAPPQCTDQVGGVVPSDTYQVLLHQDRQLRLLQAQVQMLLEAQMKHVNTQESRSTTSVAVGTGASLFWANPVQPLPHQETEAPPPTSPSSPSPSSSCRHSSSHDLSVTETVGSSEACDITNQMSPCSPTGQHSCLQSPAGVTVSMRRDEQQSFYKNLMTQLTSRLQESDHGQEVESRRRSESVVSSPSRRRQQSSDPVVSATVRQLQQLGVDVDKEDLTESDRKRVRDVESVSTLASINPAAVMSTLGVSDLSVSSLCPGGSVDLSLEANAIALRYLSDSQLSRLSLGGHAPRLVPTSSSDYLLSPSNMSLGTRQYMRKYGLIEEEDGEEEEEQEEVRVQEASTRQPLTEAPNVKPLPQSQLIRDLLPKMQLLARKATPLSADKENCSSKRPSLMRTSKHQTEGSVGNILDLSRLRQLPKLF